MGDRQDDGGKETEIAINLLLTLKLYTIGKFVITKRSNGEYHFNLKAGNGEKILHSEGYSTKDGCKGGIESVKKHAPADSNYYPETASNGKYYFNLKAANGQVIGTSELYESSSGRSGGIESVKANAPGADVVDES